MYESWVSKNNVSRQERVWDSANIKLTELPKQTFTLNVSRLVRDMHIGVRVEGGELHGESLCR